MPPILYTDKFVIFRMILNSICNHNKKMCINMVKYIKMYNSTIHYKENSLLGLG